MLLGSFFDWLDIFYSGGLGANRNVSGKLGMKLAILLYYSVWHFLLFECWIFFNSIRVSNSLDPDQARHFDSEGYQQMTKVAISWQRVKCRTTS